jgi:hypothetical protein
MHLNSYESCLTQISIRLVVFWAYRGFGVANIIDIRHLNTIIRKVSPDVYSSRSLPTLHEHHTTIFLFSNEWWVLSHYTRDSIQRTNISVKVPVRSTLLCLGWAKSWPSASVPNFGGSLLDPSPLQLNMETGSNEHSSTWPGSSPANKRQKITVACDPCRARKVRCDGTPSTYIFTSTRVLGNHQTCNCRWKWTPISGHWRGTFVGQCGRVWRHWFFRLAGESECVAQ